MFYDRFIQLCADRNISPSKAAIEAGLSKSTVSKWKSTTDAEPSVAALKKLSAYFEIPVTEVLGEEPKKPITTEDDELAQYLEELKTRPEMRMLFSITKGATKEDVERAVKIVEAALGK